MLSSIILISISKWKECLPEGSAIIMNDFIISFNLNLNHFLIFIKFNYYHIKSIYFVNFLSPFNFNSCTCLFPKISKLSLLVPTATIFENVSAYSKFILSFNSTKVPFSSFSIITILPTFILSPTLSNPPTIRISFNEI